MYTNGSYLAKQVMQVPEELILRKDVSELLPVYMLMYAKYSPFYDLRFYSYTSLEEPFNEKRKSVILSAPDQPELDKKAVVCSGSKNQRNTPMA